MLLVHPGGPFWARKDAGAWSIPKGEQGDREDALDAAKREFAEELGPAVMPIFARAGPQAFVPLGEVRQKGGKIVTAFALEADFDTSQVEANLFEMEWPPRSGRRQHFPEVDRAEWFTLAVAEEKILAGQHEFLVRLRAMAATRG